MSRNQVPLRTYKHQELIDEVNNFFIAVKIHYLSTIKLPEEVTKNLYEKYPEPEVFQVDEIMMKIINALKEQSEDMIKY